jgi:hypothetical protein
MKIHQNEKYLKSNENTVLCRIRDIYLSNLTPIQHFPPPLSGLDWYACVLGCIGCLSVGRFVSKSRSSLSRSCL